MNLVTLLYTNTNQFVSKRDLLAMEIAGEEPDTKMLSEVIPKAQVAPLSSCLFAINGYITYLNFGPSCSNLGSTKICGLCIFIRDHLKCTPHPLLPVHFVETMFLSIPLKRNDALTLGCVYRSPNSCPYAITAELCELMKVTSGESSHMLC